MKNKYLALALTATILGILLVTPIGLASITESAPNLEITNLSGTSYVFTFTQILAMPKTVVNSYLYCDGALVTYGDWGGVLLSYLLTQAHANASEVGSVRFEASDGYQVIIPIKLAMDPQIIVAYELNDKPLAEGLRLIVPDANGAVSTTTGGSGSSIDLDSGLAVEVPGPGAGVGIKGRLHARVTAIRIEKAVSSLRERPCVAWVGFIT